MRPQLQAVTSQAEWEYTMSLWNICMCEVYTSRGIRWLQVGATLGRSGFTWGRMKRHATVLLGGCLCQKKTLSCICVGAAVHMIVITAITKLGCEL